MLLEQQCIKLTWVHEKGDVSKCFASILFSGKLKLRKLQRYSPNLIIHLRKICPGKFLMKPEKKKKEKKRKERVLI